MTARQHPATVADLKALLEDLPDWAAVQVISYDETGCMEDHAPYVDYKAGVFTIDVA
jgi:hypothetical protein